MTDQRAEAVPPDAIRVAKWGSGGGGGGGTSDHDLLTNVRAADPTSTDTVRNKHVANEDLRASAAHRAAAAPHAGHAASVHQHAGEDITSGTVAVARIGTGTKDATTFYRGDGAFAVPPGGGTGTSDHDALTNVRPVDPTSADTTRNKHVANEDLRVNAAHRADTANPHGVTAAQIGAAPAGDSRFPTQDENDALVGTNGAASGANRYVTNSDPRNSDARTPTAHAHAIADLPVATSGTSSTTQIVRADDSRLSDARTPTDHAHPAQYGPWVFKGALAATAIGDAVSLPVFQARTITQIRMILSTLSTATVTVAFYRNGTLVNSYSLAANTRQVTHTVSIAVADGDYLQMIVTAAGTGGKDLTVVPRAA